MWSILTWERSLPCSIAAYNLLEECKTIVFIFGDKKGKLIIVRSIEGKYDGAFVDGIHMGTVTTIKVNEGKLPMSKKNQSITKPVKSDVEIIPEKRLIFTDEEQRNLDLTDKEVLEQIEKENRTFLESNKTPVKLDSGDIMIATGSLDRTIKILIIKRILKNEKFHYKNVVTFLSLRHRYRISDIDWDPYDPDRFLNVCQKHVTVQVWTINPVSKSPHKNSDDKGSRDDADIDKYYVSNIRGHKGFVTTACWSHNEKNCVLTCSDDQSIKVWNLINIRCRQPPMPMRRDDREEEVREDEDDFRREDDQFRDDFGQKNGRSKLESYKQGGEYVNRAVKYRMDSDDENEDEASYDYYNKSK